MSDVEKYKKKKFIRSFLEFNRHTREGGGRKKV
jgi:hypothetical protein